MRKFTAIFFLSVYLLAATETHQFLKLPILYQHFTEHQSEDENMSFLAYLKLHYLDPFILDKDVEKDLDLPFKSADDCLVTSIAMGIPATCSFELPTRQFIVQNEYLTAQESAVSAGFNKAIFQPPRG